MSDQAPVAGLPANIAEVWQELTRRTNWREQNAYLQNVHRLLSTAFEIGGNVQTKALAEEVQKVFDSLNRERLLNLQLRRAIASLEAINATSEEQAEVEATHESVDVDDGQVSKRVRIRVIRAMLAAVGVDSGITAIAAGVFMARLCGESATKYRTMWNNPDVASNEGTNKDIEAAQEMLRSVGLMELADKLDAQKKPENLSCKK